MALERHGESYLASDQLDYVNGSSINKTHAYKGLAAFVRTAVPAVSGRKDGRPTVEQTDTPARYVLGAITHVGNKGCNVVQRGRFILQASSAFETADLNKTVVGVTGTENLGKVEAADRAVNLNNALNIVGGGNDDSADGIGHYYLIEKM